MDVPSPHRSPVIPGSWYFVLSQPVCAERTVTAVAPPSLVPTSAAPTRRGLSKRRVAVLAGAAALASLSIDLYLPAFPELSRELDASPAAVQLTLTACVIGLALGQLVAGPVSDAIGRRVPLILGLGGWALAAFACALAPSIGTLTLLRFMQGLAGSAGVVVARAVVRDLSSGPDLVRALAQLMLVTGVVPVLAPTVGGVLLEHMSWRGLFVVLGCLGTAFSALVAVGLPETLSAENRRGLQASVRSYRVLAVDRSFVVACALAALTFAPLFIYVSSSSFVLRTSFSLTPGEFGLLFGVNSVALVAGNQVIGRTTHRWPARITLPVAIACGTVAALLLLAAGAGGLGGVWGVAIPLFVMVACVGATLPTTASLAMTAHPGRAGAAAALLGLVQMAVGPILAPLVGFFDTASVVPLGIMLVACHVAALTVYVAGRRRLALTAW